MNVAYYYIRNNAILKNVKRTVNDKTKTIISLKRRNSMIKLSNLFVYLFTSSSVCFWLIIQLRFDVLPIIHSSSKGLMVPD